jgi:formylglycine-generating enzyme required for sulfatase activity
MVTLDGYYMDTYEVTNVQYEAYVTTGGGEASNYASDARFNGGQQPVVGVDWEDASGYCTWAGLRLPTEAEWEKAARGTDGRIYPWGDERATCERAVMDDGGDGCGQGSGAWDVGSKPDGVSPYGAHDMAGNVWEWVHDWYDSDYYNASPERNPLGPEARATYRVLRGGSWFNNPGYLRASYRYRVDPSNRDYRFGFRCAQDE